MSKIFGGSQANQLDELILKSLNTARGTAYSTDPGTIVYAENKALAEALTLPWRANNRLRNQFSPSTMYAYLDRWEKILNIYSSPLDTVAQRQARIATIWSLWTKPPTITNIRDIVKNLIPSIFVDLEFRTPFNASGTTTYGALEWHTSLGTVFLNQGPYWTSSVSNFRVRVWQPRDKNNNKLMSDSDFANVDKSFQAFLVNYLPAYTTFRTYQLRNARAGTITVTPGSSSVTGTSTNFLTQLEPGMIFDVVDDAGFLVTYTVATVISDTSLTITTLASDQTTNGVYYTSGFFLDVPGNLDADTLF